MTRVWYSQTARKSGKRAGGMAERPVQRGAIRLLAMQGIEAAHVPNGAHLAGDKLARIKQMAAMRADGLRPGFPDLILFGKRPLEIGFMEVKREIGNDLEDEQIWWRDLLLSRGMCWAMIRQPEEALTAVREWGWIK